MVIGPLTYDVDVPPVGTTALVEVFTTLSIFVADVVIIPFVKSRFPFISIVVLFPIVRPAVLFISK